MSLKRPLSPTSLPPSKRRLVESWIETGSTDYPLESIETVVTPLSAPSLDHDYPESVSTMSAGIDGGISSVTRSPSVANLLDALANRSVSVASVDQIPSNWEELMLMVAAPRTSPEPIQDDYRRVYGVLRASHFDERSYHDEVVSPEYLRSIWYATLELAANKCGGLQC